MSQRIRIKDIAEKAGVSTGTVDRVLHQRGNVSAKAKAKVMAALEELDYEPNIIASRLAYNTVTEIVVLMPNPAIDPYWANPMQGIEKAIKGVQHYGVNLHPQYFNLFNPKSFVEAGKQALKREPEALLFPPVFLKESQTLLEECKEKGILVSFINTDIAGQEVLSYVGQNSYQSGVLAGKLFNVGQAKPDPVLVLHLGKEVTNAQHLIDKEKGIRDYYAEQFEEREAIIVGQFADFTDAQRLSDYLDTIFQKRPGIKGIFVSNSRAHFLVRALEINRQEGLRIIGFDLLPENLALLKEGKITFLINQNPAQQGYLGVMNIINKLVFKKKVPRILHLPLDIIVPENAQNYLDREYQFVV